MTEEQWRAATRKSAPSSALDLSGSESDHYPLTLDSAHGVISCGRCGAGVFVDRPALWPKACDATGFRRRRMGL